MITTLTTRTVMEHLWKATREKLLSGKNNFRNENDLLLPICITFFFFAMRAQGKWWRRKEESFHYNAPTVLSLCLRSPALLRHLNGELLIEVKELICWSRSGEKKEKEGHSVNYNSGLHCRFAILTSLHSPQTNPLWLFSDDFLWVKKIFNFLASFVFQRWWGQKKKEGGDEKALKRARGRKKSWNYDDLIRKVRNNEIFLMRNFFTIRLRTAFVTVNWPGELLLCFCCCGFPFSIIHNRGKKGILMKKKKGNWKKGIFHRQAAAAKRRL